MARTLNVAAVAFRSAATCQHSAPQPPGMTAMPRVRWKPALAPRALPKAVGAHKAAVLKGGAPRVTVRKASAASMARARISHAATSHGVMARAAISRGAIMVARRALIAHTANAVSTSHAVTVPLVIVRRLPARKASAGLTSRVAIVLPVIARKANGRAAMHPVVTAAVSLSRTQLVASPGKTGRKTAGPVLPVTAHLLTAATTVRATAKIVRIVPHPAAPLGAPMPALPIAGKATVPVVVKPRAAQPLIRVPRPSNASARTAHPN